MYRDVTFAFFFVCWSGRTMCVHHLFCTPHHTNLSLHPIQALSHLLAVGLCPLARRFDPSVANVVF